ncbi:MAG: zeta toxin family protein [bacterium]
MLENTASKNGEKPLFLLLAGSNGAGKSTYIKSEDFKDVLKVLEDRFNIMALESYQIINPDIISISHLMINPEIDEMAANLWAVQEIEKSINKYFNLCKSFAIETVLSTDKYIKYVEEAKLKGYITAIVYIGLDSPETAIKRVRMRVKTGGHDVSEDKIRKRFNNSINNVKYFVKLADFSIIHSNIGDANHYKIIAIGLNGKVAIKDEKTLSWINKALKGLPELKL